MKRNAITLDEIASYHNLTQAAVRAAKGKWLRPDVVEFFAQFDKRIENLRFNVLNNFAPRGTYKKFTIYDPKKRDIHAACFDDRVLHHALMKFAGPVLERAMVANTYACLPGRGVHAAVIQVQHYVRRYPWFVKIDIKHYFDCIGHDELLHLLSRRFKGKDVLRLFERIEEGSCTSEGRGLPIGSLTSQYFANYYLDGFDRFIQRELACLGMVRYMDDVIIFCASRQEAHGLLMRMKHWLIQERGLTVKPDAQLNRSAHGVAFCGSRITQGSIRLGRRKKRRYVEKRAYWEREFKAGNLNSVELQRAYSAVQAITHGADALAWRQRELAIAPSVAL